MADAGYVRCGYLLTVPERLVEACRGNVELLQGLGLDTRFLEPGEIAAAEPELSLDGVAGAAYEPDGGFADAQKMCLGWYAAASAQRPRRPARHRRHAAPRRERPGAGRRDRRAGSSPPTASCSRPGRGGTTCCARSAPSSRSRCAASRWRSLRQPIGAPLPTAVCSDAVTNVVVRPDRGQQFYAVAYFGDEPLERADDCDNGISDGYEDVVRRAVSERYPRLGGFELRARRSPGRTTRRPTGTRSSARARASRACTSRSAWCGHGFKLSPAVGEVVAAEVAGRTPPIDVTDLRPTRFAEGKLLRLAYGPGARA